MSRAAGELTGACASCSPEKVQEVVQTRLAAIQAAPLAPLLQTETRAFRFLPLAEVLAAPKAPDWLICYYLEADTLAVLFGASGSMKSFVAIDLSFCIATGRSWHGAPVPHPGPVFYIAGEGFRGLAKRLKALMVAHAVEEATIPLFIASEPAQFLDRANAEAVARAVEVLTQLHGPPRLIVVDTLNRCFGSGDENKTEDMTKFIAALDRLRGRFKCAVLVIHHTGLSDKERARGASALRAALDFEYRLDVHDRQRTLKCTKSKDHDAPPTVTFEPITVGTGWRDPETGQEIMSCVLRRMGGVEPCSADRPLLGAKRVALEALLTCCSTTGQASLDAWRKEATLRPIAKTEKAKERAFRRAVHDLVDLGHVLTEDNHYRPADKRTKADNDRSSLNLSGGTPADGQGQVS